MMKEIPHALTEERATQLLTRLVQCPSVSPPHDTPLAPPYGEAALVQILAEHLDRLGASISIKEVAPDRPNLLAHFEGRDTSHTILLDAHTDTVSHLHMDIAPFAAEVRGGRLYGRGACDTKGPMTAMLLALEQLVGTGELACNVIFAATCDEEAGGGGARHLITSGIQADFAIVAEPTDLCLVTRHKGILRASIAISGKAVHSSEPQRGENAIYPMGALISELERASREFENCTPVPDLGTPTLAVTMISGGEAANIIPPRCSLMIDRRTLPSEDAEEVKVGIEELVGRSTASTLWAVPQVDWLQEYPPMSTLHQNSDVKRLVSALEVADQPQAFKAVAYGTNGGFYSQAGIPAIVFGPGSIADAHTANEFIDLAQVVTAANVLQSFLSIERP